MAGPDEGQIAQCVVVSEGKYQVRKSLAIKVAIDIKIEKDEVSGVTSQSFWDDGRGCRFLHLLHHCGIGCCLLISRVGVERLFDL